VTHSPHTTRTASALVALLTLAVAGLVALSLSGSAAAATPCGRKILADWYDNGRIDKLYPLHCYEEAVDMIPKDIEDYVDARDVIERALQAAVGGHLAPGGDDPTPNNGHGKGGRGIDGGSPVGSSGSDGGTGPGGGSAASSVDTSSPSSVPIPLLVLGGMSLALLAAGGLGYYSRRRAQADDTPDDDQLG
jgi:uncharacterized membrane protein YgcG